MTGPSSKETVEVVFDHRPPALTFDDLLLPPEVGERIEEAVALFHNHDLVFETWGLKTLFPRDRRLVLNFHGPPGTGKSHSAEALAHRLGLDYLGVNYATMESKYVGDTAKNIAAVFRHARKHPVLMHWDESDTILGKRLTSIRQSADHAVNTARTTMLIELERHDGPVVFSTNLVTNYDRAFERRIDAFIEFRLPVEAERLALLERLVPRTLPRVTSLDLARTAALTEGFSPFDLRKTILVAASRMARSTGIRALTNELLAGAAEDIRRGRAALAGGPPTTDTDPPCLEIPRGAEAPQAG